VELTCLFCSVWEICWSWNCQVIAVPVAGPEAKQKAVASGRMAGEDRSRIPPTKAQWWCLLLSKSNRNSLDFQVSNVSNVCKGFYSSRCSSLSGDGLHLEIIKIFSQDTSSQDPARKVCRIEATVSVPRHELRKFLLEEQISELSKFVASCCVAFVGIWSNLHVVPDVARLPCLFHLPGLEIDPFRHFRDVCSCALESFLALCHT
jgi:hypothetical protein